MSEVDEAAESGENPEDELETRPVKVDDPALSAATNHRLTEQLQDVVGARSVEVPKSRPHASQGERIEPSRSVLASSSSLMVIIGFFAGLVVIGIIATSVTGSWWFVVAALVIDVIGIVVVATNVIRMTTITERPEASLAAAMQEEGVTNPEERFTEMVEEYRQGDDDGDGHRDTAVEDDPVAAAGEQKSSMTPTGGESEAVGP